MNVIIVAILALGFLMKLRFPANTPISVNLSTVRISFYVNSKNKLSVTYFAVRKTTQHKLPQLKLGPTIYAFGPPLV